MSKAKELLSCRALALTEPTAPCPRPSSVSSLMENLLKSRSPMGVRLQKRTDPNQIITALEGLNNLGFPSEESLAILADLLSRPSIAMRNSDGSTIRQATSLLTSQGATRLIATAHLVKGLPPELVLLELDIDPIDAEDDKVDLVLDVAAWHRELPTPDRAPKSLGEAWALIGDPIRRGIHGTPPDWKKRMLSIASTLGTDAQFAENSETARALNVLQLRGKYALPGTFTLDEVRDHTPLIIVGDYDSTYEAIERGLVRQLIDAIRTDIEAGRKSIGPGETIYHRKVNSGGGRDYFGAALGQPCQHGPGSFVRFHSAPQAVKGMLAIYSNFDESMLFHCDRYPNCNVYAVRRPPSGGDGGD